jgi:hypothetical protein
MASRPDTHAAHTAMELLNLKLLFSRRFYVGRKEGSGRKGRGEGPPGRPRKNFRDRPSGGRRGPEVKSVFHSSSLSLEDAKFHCSAMCQV